jgi:hypothetical protein
MSFYQYLGNLIIPTDEVHHFSEGWATTNRIGFSQVNSGLVDVC